MVFIKELLNWIRNYLDDNVFYLAEIDDKWRRRY
jgi:hypothetical protein